MTLQKDAYYCTKLNELKHLPETIDRDLVFSFRDDFGKKIRHMDSVNTVSVRGNVDMRQMHLRSLAGIGKRYFKTISGDLIIRETVRSNLLGVMMMKGVNRLLLHENWRLSTDPNREAKDRLKLAVQIINKHLSSEERCSMACKEELMEHGLKEYAKF